MKGVQPAVRLATGFPRPPRPRRLAKDAQLAKTRSPAAGRRSLRSGAPAASESRPSRLSAALVPARPRTPRNRAGGRAASRSPAIRVDPCRQATDPVRYVQFHCLISSIV